MTWKGEYVVADSVQGRIMGNVIKWNEYYTVGKDVVDQANQEIFDLLEKIRVGNAENDAQFDCKQAIEELKACFAKVFGLQEEQMRIDERPYFDEHKKLHDNFIANTIPQLERELNEKNFSKDAVFHLVAILSGWIIGHILFEDKAAFGNSLHAGFEMSSEHAKENVDKTIKNVMKDMLGLEEPVVINDCYEGEPVPNSRGLNFVYNCGHILDQSVIFVAENSLILHMIECICATKVDKLSNEASGAYIQFFGYLGQELLKMYEVERWPILQYIRPFSRDKFHIRYASVFPQYSSLWHTEYGDIAIIISED